MQKFASNSIYYSFKGKHYSKILSLREATEPQPSARFQQRGQTSISRPAPRSRPAARQRTRVSVPAPRRVRPQSSVPARPLPSVPARSRGLPRRRQPINRFQPFTTPRPAPQPEIQQLFNARHAENTGQPNAPVITSRIIIPAAEYYQTISPNYQYEQNLGTAYHGAALPQQVTSVPALPYSEYSASDQYGHLFGSAPVNYGFSINHI